MTEGGYVFSNNVTLSVDDAINITQHPEDVLIGEGGRVMLTITAEGPGSDQFTYQWKKMGNNSLPKRRASGGDTTQLVITSVATSDRGSYYCIVTNQWGRMVESMRATVKILAITTNPQDITTAVGTTVTVTCSSSGVDDVMYQWMRKKKMIRSKARGANTNRLVITNIEPDDSGEYRCTVSSGDVSVNSEYGTVTVLALPVITRHPNNNDRITVAEGSHVMLRCEATGGGTLNYQWRRQSKSLPNRARLSDNNQNLTITGITTNHNGEYYCEVDNGGTSVSSNKVQVTARVRPTIVKDPMRSSLSIVSGNEVVTLTCEVSGDDITGGYWERINGSPLQDKNNMSSLNNDKTILQLTITKARPGHSGRYYCVVYSQWGLDQSSNAQVTITIAPPTITTQPMTVSVVALQNVTITCEARGFNVKYRWRRHSSSGSIGRQSSLIITRATPPDEDQYYCIAMTEGGYVFSNNVTLSVDGQLKILKHPPNVTISENQDVNLTVIADGVMSSSGRFKYRWHRNTKALPIGRSYGINSPTLLIKSVIEHDEGSYYCTVTNEWNNTVTSYHGVLEVIFGLPVIHTHPSDQHVRLHATAMFNCVATGNGTLTYFWSKDGNRIQYDVQHLAIQDVKAMNSGFYQCHVRNQDGLMANSMTAELLVIVEITSHPVLVVEYVNTTASLSCEATGSVPISYQWRRVNGNISSERARGVNTTTLTISPVRDEDDDEYFCMVSNKGRNGRRHHNKSQNAAVIIYGPPTFQPLGPVHYVIVGHSFVLNCTATNDPQSPNNLTFRWFKDSDRIKTDNKKLKITESVINVTTVTSRLVISDLQVTRHNRTYTCEVHNTNKRNIWKYSVNRNSIVIVETPTIITSQPQSIIVYVNSNITLACEATGSVPISYQWRRVNGKISKRATGVNTPALTISLVREEDENEYYCVTTNGGVDGMRYSDTSQIVQVTVFGPPTFQPFDPVHYVIVGHSFVLNCTATNDPQSPNNLAFRWYKDSVRSRNRIDNRRNQWDFTKHLINATTVTSQLVVSELQVDRHNGRYICEVHNNNGTSSVKQNTMVVVETPTTITTHPQTAVVFVNSNTTLSCEATGSDLISYHWKRVNGEIFSERATGVNAPTLVILPVREEDEDEYYCVATNGGVDGMRYNDTSQKAQVIVFGPPTLQSLNTTYYGITDNMFTLNCIATNDPQSPNNITFEWFKDGIKQNGSSEIKSKFLDESTSQLVIDEPNSDQHSGRYSCGVYNNQSSNIVYTNTTVIIEIADIRNSKTGMIEPHSVNKSHFTSVIQLPNIDIPYRTINRLFVVVTTNNKTTPSQVPDSALVSYGDLGSAGALASYGGIVGDKSSIMYVAAVLNGDLGEKMIVLGNESISRVGDKEYYNAPLDRQRTYYTFVRAYADNHNDSNPRYTSSGLSAPIALPVSSSGGGGSSGGEGAIIGVVVVLIIIIMAIIIVIIVLLWYRKKYNKKQAPILAAVNPTKQDIALQEKSSEKAMLGPVETKSLPVVNIKEQEVKTSVGQPTTLYVEARGNPPPEISWTKNGLPVNDPLLQNGSLYMHSTTHSDQGTYTVTATSDEGSTSEAIKVLVLNPQYVPSNRYKPIKMENFAEHLAMLHSSMNQQFTTDYDSLVVQNDFSFNGAKLEINVMKNRYKNILPYDHARVPLTLQDKIAGTDYINASFIDGYNERKAYIACQGPMASTTAEFWRMIWEQNVTAIVMVTNLTEEGKPKCQQYWPDDVNKSCTYGNISVTLIQEEILAEYTIRTLAVKMIEASSEAKSVNLEVQHFHFTVWPDHGVPKYPTALLSFQKRVNKHHKRKRGSPLVVHCSAGVGRTGTFITIDMELQRIKHEGIVDVYNTVHKLRFRRNFTVQTLAQYVFIFDALMESIMCGDNSIAAPAKSAKLRLEELAKVNPATKLSGYESQYRKLQAASPKESDFQYVCANLPENRHKNRSIKRLAPDNSRVYITATGYASDYICASYIDGYRHRKAFLATEGPMNSTVVDFWGMIWDRSSHAIVMLSLLEENGKETSVKYWPDKGETLHFGPFVIETTNESKSDKYFTRRIMQVKNTSSKDSTPRTINQFQYLCWPDHSCPSEASSIMDMVEIVETVQRKSKNGPITVHCSDGLGRTGAFCALMMCHDRFKTEHMADVFYAIKTMRAQRPGMVENTAQYEFIHKTLKETMDRLETYSNF